MSEHDQRDDYDDDPHRGALAPEHIVRWPASAMWVFGLLQLIAVQLGHGVVVFLFITDGIDEGNTLSEMWTLATHEGALWLMLATWFVATAIAVLIMRAANDMKRFRRYPWVVAGAILTGLSVPFLYLGFIQLPLGIWIMLLLLRRDVRARFASVARDTTATGSWEPSRET